MQATSATYYDEYPATINALNQVEIHAAGDGYITGVYFKDGQRVTKGQKLYSIDPAAISGAYQQSVANVNVCESQSCKCTKKCRPLSELQKNDAIARKRLTMH